MVVPQLGNVPPALLVLLTVWACLLYGGMLAPEQPGKNRRMPRWMRLGSSLVLVAAAWFWWFVGREHSLRNFALLVALGMSFGTLGDFFLAEMFQVRQPLVGGLGAFGVGHLAYIAGFGVLIARLVTGKALTVAFLLAILTTALGWWLLVYPTARSASLRWAALAYAVILASTAGLAVGIGLSKPELPGLLLLGLGAALFWVSDVILALRVFRQAQFHLLDDVVWLTYGTGQMLIVFSSATVLTLGHFP